MRWKSMEERDVAVMGKCERVIREVCHDYYMYKYQRARRGN